MPILYMVCGYKGSGKDYLYKQLNKQISYNWLAYTADKQGLPLYECERLSFADQVKREIWLMLFGVDNPKAAKDMEMYKDQNISTFLAVYNLFNKYQDYIEKYKTLRDLIIEHAMNRRKEDPIYWARYAIQFIKPDKNYIITDWRFRNEIELIQQTLAAQFNIITVRVYRSAVDRPIGIVSENDLDNYLANYLLVTSEHDFNKALQIFPQYHTYNKV